MYSKLRGICKQRWKDNFKRKENKEGKERGKKKRKKSKSKKNRRRRVALREVIVKIGLERIDTQEGITVKALLNSRATGLVMSSEFAKRKEFELKNIKRPIYVRNVDRTFNKKRLIEYTVKVNIYYQEHRKKTEINGIRGQK